MGYGKTCAYNQCRNHNKKKEYLNGVYTFITFPKSCMIFRHKYFNTSKRKHITSCVKCTKAEKWIMLCKPKFGNSIENIPRKAHICTMHFDSENGSLEPNAEPNSVQETPKRYRKRTSLQEKYRKNSISRSDIQEEFEKPEIKSQIVYISTSTQADNFEDKNVNISGKEKCKKRKIQIQSAEETDPLAIPCIQGTVKKELPDWDTNEPNARMEQIENEEMPYFSSLTIPSIPFVKIELPDYETKIERENEELPIKEEFIHCYNDPLAL